jgi:hypothetical protein
LGPIAQEASRRIRPHRADTRLLGVPPLLRERSGELRYDRLAQREYGMVSPHALFQSALADAGWQILTADEPHGGPNPTRLQTRRGKVQHRLLVYAWRITSEGTGRHKAGRMDLDYRIQTTRSHSGPIDVIPGHVTLGVGWDDERELFAAFDPWTKRFTGVSSSVHFHRSLLDSAATVEWVEEERDDGPEVAFVPSRIDQYLAWAFGEGPRPLFRVTPERFEADGDLATLLIDPIRERLAYGIRPRDSLVVVSNGQIADRSVWSVREIDPEERPTQSGNYNRVALRMTCRRIGVIKRKDVLEGTG